MSLPYTLKQYQQMEERLSNHIAASIPNSKIKAKQDSLKMKILSKILFFVQDFMNRFTTTFYPDIYFPRHRLPPHLDSWKAISYIGTLAHEYVHLSDRKRMGQLFNFLYLCPQILAIPLALLSFSSLWWLFALVLLAPIPSIGRSWLEFRGYRMSMAIRWWLENQRVPSEHYAKKFTGPNYYFMFPFRKFLIKKFDKAFEMIQNDYNLSPELLEVKKVLFSK